MPLQPNLGKGVGGTSEKWKRISVGGSSPVKKISISILRKKLREAPLIIQDTIRLMLQGASIKDTALELHKSERTIKHYRHWVYDLVGLDKANDRVKAPVIINLFYRHTRGKAEGAVIYLNWKQYRIVELLALGYNNIEIAKCLQVTENVIKNYNRRIYDIAGMSSRSEMVEWFYTHKHLISITNRSSFGI